MQDYDAAAEELPEELSRAGAVVAHAIKHMLEKNLSPIAVASALLGGALGLLSHSMETEAVLGVLENAMNSVRDGEFADAGHPVHPEQARPQA